MDTQSGASQAKAACAYISSFHKRKEVKNMAQSYILTKQFIDRIMAVARENVEQDGVLQPVLIVFPTDDRFRFTMLPVHLPDDAENRARYFAGIWRQMQKSGYKPLEVLFVTEGWFVNAQTAPNALRLSPRAHPCRQEALILVGRNADNTGHTHVVQPFTRDQNNHPVWDEPVVAAYNEPPESGSRASGLLDYLFASLAEKA
jgi:hypothetical protein